MNRFHVAVAVAGTSILACVACTEDDVPGRPQGDGGGANDAAPEVDAAGDGGQGERAWRPMSLEGAPSARLAFDAVWTGQEMIVWGGGGCSADPCDEDEANGYLATGARFHPEQNVWETVATPGAPTPRNGEAFVWAGDRFFVWSGHGPVPKGGPVPAPLEDGAWYSPTDDAWQVLSTLGAPRPRVGAQAVWTGTEVLMWGGGVPEDPLGGFRSLNDGARFDPQAGAWRPLAPVDIPEDEEAMSPFVEWTGAEMIVWDGRRTDPPRPGWRYDPEADSWSDMAPHEGPDRTCGIVWTGAELLAFGHASFSRYDPATDRWTVSPSVDTLCARPIWTGSELLLWRPAGSPPGTSVRFDPDTETTRPIESEGAPSPRLGFAAMWTGEEMLVWGGDDEETEKPTNTGSLYRPPEPR